MYIRGDLIPGVGIVDMNSADFFWPIAMNGDVFYGVVKVGQKFCDAKAGNILSDTEFESRRNKISYDYESKWEHNQLWREHNAERILKGEINDRHRGKPGWIKRLIYIFMKWRKGRKKDENCI